MMQRSTSLSGSLSIGILTIAFAKSTPLPKPRLASYTGDKRSTVWRTGVAVSMVEFKPYVIVSSEFIENERIACTACTVHMSNFAQFTRFNRNCAICIMRMGQTSRQNDVCILRMFGMHDNSMEIMVVIL